jgi:hypothetical protein
MKCDFCSSKIIATTFKAHSFDYVRAGVPIHSDSDWASCHTCAEIVRSGNHAALLERSYITWFDERPDTRSFNREQRRALRREMKAWHTNFWRNLIGEEEIPVGVYRVIDHSVAPDPVRERVRQIMLSSMDADQRALFEKDWDEAEAKDDA